MVNYQKFPVIMQDDSRHWKGWNNTTGSWKKLPVPHLHIIIKSALDLSQKLTLKLWILTFNHFQSQILNKYKSNCQKPLPISKVPFADKINFKAAWCKFLINLVLFFKAVHNDINKYTHSKELSSVSDFSRKIPDIKIFIIFNIMVVSKISHQGKWQPGKQ